MTSSAENCNDLFTAGYEKGRADGIAQAISVVSLIIDFHPGQLRGTSLAILPEASGNTLARMIAHFGDSIYRAGRRDEKTKTKKVQEQPQ